MSIEFNRCLAYTLNEEGGYAELAGDEVTNHGVQQKTWEAWIGHKVSKQEMKNLSQDDVKDLYLERYWIASGCPVVWYPLSLCIFDFAVHSGPKTAVMQLQQVVGAVVDGILGKRTVEAINKVAPEVLIKRYLAKRLEYAQKARLWKLYKKGWTNRFKNLEKFCLEELARDPTRVGK